MAFTEKFVSSLASGSGTGNSEGDPWTIDQAASGVTPGTWVNVKDDGIYNRSSGNPLLLSVAGNDTYPIVWEGYLTAPHDAASRFRIRGPGAAFSHNMAITSNHNHVIRADCEKSDLNNVFGVSNSRGFALVDCVFNNTNTGAASAVALSNTTQGGILGCYLRTAGTGSVLTQSLGAGPVCITRNVFVSAGSLTANATAISMNGFRNHSITDNLIIIKGTNAGTAAVRITVPAWNQMDIVHVTGNTIVGGQYGVYVNATGGQSTRTTSCMFVVNNLISTLTAGVANAGAATFPTGMYCYGNAVYAPTAFDVGDIPVNDNVILAADPFENIAADDYRLNDVANGGALVRGAAFPRSQFISALSHARSIGAFEYLASSGGGGGPGIIPHPLGRF